MRRTVWTATFVLALSGCGSDPSGAEGGTGTDDSSGDGDVSCEEDPNQLTITTNAAGDAPYRELDVPSSEGAGLRTQHCDFWDPWL